jgi:hypothetical protein
VEWAPGGWRMSEHRTFDNYDAFYDDDEPYDADEEFLDFVCGMRPDGQCSLAGSEDCDFECPRWRR